MRIGTFFVLTLVSNGQKVDADTNDPERFTGTEPQIRMSINK